MWLPEYIENTRASIEAIPEPFMKQAAAAKTWGATYEPVATPTGVRMWMRLLGTFSCDYGPTHDRSLDDLRLEIDALEIVAHPQAEALQRWISDYGNSSATPSTESPSTTV